MTYFLPTFPAFSLPNSATTPNSSRHQLSWDIYSSTMTGATLEPGTSSAKPRTVLGKPGCWALVFALGLCIPYSFSRMFPSVCPTSYLLLDLLIFGVCLDITVAQPQGVVYLFPSGSCHSTRSLLLSLHCNGWFVFLALINSLKARTVFSPLPILPEPSWVWHTVDVQSSFLELMNIHINLSLSIVI